MVYINWQLLFGESNSPEIGLGDGHLSPMAYYNSEVEE